MSNALYETPDLIAAAAAFLLAAQDDPPGRVGRMSYLYGTACSFRPGV